MQKTNLKTRSKTSKLVWFRAQIPAHVNDGLKKIAEQKTALNSGNGASFTKEGVIVALMKFAVQARQSGSMIELAQWLLDGRYNGKTAKE